MNVNEWLGWGQSIKMTLYSSKILYSVLFNTESDGLPELETIDRLQKGCLQLFTMEALGKNVDSDT